jgi:hypothetical protein
MPEVLSRCGSRRAPNYPSDITCVSFNSINIQQFKFFGIKYVDDACGPDERRGAQSAPEDPDRHGAFEIALFFGFRERRLEDAKVLRKFDDAFQRG